MGREQALGRMDTVSIAGVAVFSALSLTLGAASQALGLNFPLIPYLQFDLGEIAIVLAFFIFGPVPALVSSGVEFVGLMFFGQNAPVGPVLKLIALTSSVVGLWAGSRVIARLGRGGLGTLVGSGGALGAAVRAAALTVPNFYLIVYLFTPAATRELLLPAFALAGIVLTDSNVLLVVLGFTAVFNVLQFAFAVGVSYLVLKVPAMARMRIGGRSPWFVLLLGERGTSSTGRSPSDS